MRRHQGVLFVLPAIIVLALLVAYPIVYTGILSVTDQTGEYVGLKNYAAMTKARVTTQAVKNTVYYVLGSIVLQVVLGTLTGILLNSSMNRRGSTAPASGTRCAT
jgi:multiple sugar transport system permease protein